MSIETTKTKTKMKSGTIAIIALSIVLVLSLVTTITLAYFTASRNVVTTIQFANGVRLQMGGVYNMGSTTEDTPPSTGPVQLYWKATQGGGMTEDENDENNGHYISADDAVVFEEVLVRVVDNSAYIAVRVAISAVDTANSNSAVDLSTSTGTPATSTYLKDHGFAQPAMDSAWKAYNVTLANETTNNAPAANGWFMYTGAGSTAAALAPNYTADNDETTAGQHGYVSVIPAWTLISGANADVNYFASKKFTCEIIVFASNTVDGLNAQVAAYDADMDSQNTGAQPVATYDTTNKVVHAVAAGA